MLRRALAAAATALLLATPAQAADNPWLGAALPVLDELLLTDR